MNNITLPGIVWAKDVYQSHGVNHDGKKVLSKKQGKVIWIY